MTPRGQGKRKASLKANEEALSEAVAADVTDYTTAAMSAAAAADQDEASAAVSANKTKRQTKTTKKTTKKETEVKKKKTAAKKRKPAESSSLAADVTDNATAAATGAAAAHHDASSAASVNMTKGKAKTTQKKTKKTAGKKKTATGKRKSEESTSAPAAEKRAKLYRATCPVALEDRILRASTQRLYLVHREEVDPETSKSCKLTVLGSTGNCYDVTLAEIPTCSCPDYIRKRDLCKHILFVTLKVVGLPRRDPLVFQKAFLLSELRSIFTTLNSRRFGGTVLANETVRQNYEKLKNSKSTALKKRMNGEEKEEEEPDEGKVKRRSLDGGDECESDCPICFDSLLDCPFEQLTYCRAACGVNFHADCIHRWTSTSMHGKNPTCPNCRQPWEDPNSSKVQKKGSSGFPSDSHYLNLGRLQGQSATRDTSTYYSPGRWR